jgi:bifunctional non-homologous end joining protein LigD
MSPSRNDAARTKLEKYRERRDFERTAEPAGGESETSSSGRLFVVQKHQARRLHYDFRLELDGVLKSWAVPKGPSLDPSQKPLAVQTEDHPLEYAQFEGIIPEGEYGAGTVMVWDIGEWEPLADPHEGLAKGDLKFRLHGDKLSGEFVLARMKGKSSDNGKNWLLIKKKDDSAQPIDVYNVLGESPRSALTGRSLEEIADDRDALWTRSGEQRLADRPSPEKRAPARRGAVTYDVPGARKAPLPEFIPPQLATPAADVPVGDDWIHEIKLDGYRLLCRVEEGDVRLLTRRGNDWTARMPSVRRAAAKLNLTSGMLDGEVVVLDERGVSDFQALQNAFKSKRANSMTYFVFDLLHADGYDLTQLPLLERKALVRELIQRSPDVAPVIHYGDHIQGKGEVVFQQAAQAGLEVIISKRA